MATIHVGSAASKQPLCFDDGDVVVELSSQPNPQYLLIHKTILETVAPPLAAAIGSRWCEPRKIERSGKVVDVFHLKLAPRDGTFSLVAKV
jgi:hypothetical protein